MAFGFIRRMNLQYSLQMLRITNCNPYMTEHTTMAGMYCNARSAFSVATQG